MYGKSEYNKSKNIESNLYLYFQLTFIRGHQLIARVAGQSFWTHARAVRTHVAIVVADLVGGAVVLKNNPDLSTF